MLSTSTSAARAIARAQISTLVTATNRCVYAIDGLFLDAYVKALVDTSAFAFGEIDSREYGVFEVSSNQFSTAYSTSLAEMSLVDRFYANCMKCCRDD